MSSLRRSLQESGSCADESVIYLLVGLCFFFFFSTIFLFLAVRQLSKRIINEQQVQDGAATDRNVSAPIKSNKFNFLNGLFPSVINTGTVINSSKPPTYPPENVKKNLLNAPPMFRLQGQSGGSESLPSASDSLAVNGHRLGSSPSFEEQAETFQRDREVVGANKTTKISRLRKAVQVLRTRESDDEAEKSNFTWTPTIFGSKRSNV